MAKFELPIYGNDDEVLKTFKTDHVTWGTLMQAIELQDSLKSENYEEQLKLVSSFILKVFPGMTEEDLDKADCLDVMNTFKQLGTVAGKIGGNSKNAQ